MRDPQIVKDILVEGLVGHDGLLLIPDVKESRSGDSCARRESRNRYSKIAMVVDVLYIGGRREDRRWSERK